MDLFNRWSDEAPLTVTDFTRRVKALLEGEVPSSWIVGEISNLRVQSSGHIYFSLKDAGAQLPVVMFRGDASRLRFVPRDGLEIVAQGQLSVYEPHGRYQLVARSMEESGQGRLHREFERLKRKLFEEGLFDPARKRPLPAVPLRVGIVTSPTGAALQDFLRILKRRGWSGRVAVFPSKVQGLGAAAEIAAAIEFANRIGGLDLIVVGRGGGSLEDLWCFNEEIVARAVASSALPVISAVGHEIDFTLSDLAADARAETPSAAAELISSAFIEIMDRLELARNALWDHADDRLLELKRQVATLGARLKALSPQVALENGFLRLDELAARLQAVARQREREKRDALVSLSQRLDRIDLEGPLRVERERLSRKGRRFDRSADSILREWRARLDSGRIKLEALSPRATLGRGFAMLRTGSGELLTSVASARVGMAVKADLRDGSLDLRVEAGGSD